MEKKIVRKRKTQEISQEIVENPRKILNHQQHFLLNNQEKLPNDELNLSLSSSSFTPPPLNNNNSGLSSRRGRRRASTTRLRTEGGRAIIKTDTVTPPFRWATNRRATVHSMEYLVSQGINTITGDVQCKKCEKNFEMELNLEEKFRELVFFIVNEGDMRHRAPEAWMEPILPTCEYCGHVDSCKPLIAEKKRSINWLFLLLGQLLGCCTLEQLKWFCKHTQNHRTGAKDRVLFLSYYTLCKQLDSNGPFTF